MSQDRREAGSYRDPGGYVFHHDGRVYRAVLEPARAQYEALRQAAPVHALMREGAIVGSREVEPNEARRLAPGASHVVEHDRLPFVSYPFEWPFALLRKAARFHLDLHRRLLEAGFTLSDATAYNVQFLGMRPLFIDLLSLRPYRDGELWHGHHQFMQQFVHPLLLSAVLGVPHNNWYRGNLDGIRRQDLVRCLPTLKRFSPRMFRQVVLPDMLDSVAGAEREGQTAKLASARLEKAAFAAWLRDLDAWIERLKPKTVSGTTWADYERTRTYDAGEVERKRSAVAEFVSRHAPATVWDVGCNTGEFAELALRAGCRRVIGFDLDDGALHLACERAEAKGLDFLPLRMELNNPTPGLGWRGTERQALTDRDAPDMVLALALIHHMAIANNIPLGEAVAWLASRAPLGVIEFVHKNDETVRRMLAFREDIFPDYHEDAFRSHLEAAAEITGRQEVSASGRTLYFFKRRSQ